MIKCAGSIVTWNSEVDDISVETARQIIKSNAAYEICVSASKK